MDKEAEKNKAFLMYYEYKEYIKLLPDDEKGKLLMGLLEYAEDKTEPDFTGGLLMCFQFIKTRIDRDNMRYLKQCETNKANGKKGGRPPKKQTVSEETERFSEKPNESEKNINLNRNINLNLNKDKKNMSFSKNDASVDYENILLLFNTICKSLPSVKKLNDTRRRRIKAACKEFGGDFELLFTKVQDSDFLTGRTGKWNGCSFDWILKPENLLKILEGNYDNGRNGSAQQNDQNPFMSLALEDDNG